MTEDMRRTVAFLDWEIQRWESWSEQPSQGTGDDLGGLQPYAAKVAGIPLKWTYEVNTGEWEFEWVIPHTKEDAAKKPEASGAPTVTQPPHTTGLPLTSNTTEIFFPHYLSQDRELSITSSGPSISKFTSEYNPSLQTIYIRQLNMTPGQRYRIKIRLEPGLKPVFELNDFWTDFAGYVYLVVGIVIGFVGWFVVGLL